MGGFAPCTSLPTIPRSLRTPLAYIAFFYLLNVMYIALTVLVPVLSTLQMVTDNPLSNPVRQI